MATLHALRPLIEHWARLAADVEWLCHVGIGRYFAPWHAPTSDDYAAQRAALLRRVSSLERHGVLTRSRALLLRAAVAAHGAPYPMRAGKDVLHARDEALRRAARIPECLRAVVREHVPVPPWPLPRYIPPPPVLPEDLTSAH